MKNLFLLFISIFLLQGCSSSKNNADNFQSTTLPELLTRSKKIQLGKEWDFVQNYYSTQIQAIRKNESPLEAKLKLAQLFIKEARITGEHGHYYPAALLLTNEIITAKPKDNDLLFRTLTTKSGVELSQHEFTQALQTGEEALLLNNKNAQVYGVLTDAYVELGYYKKAVEMADKMVSIKPDIRSYARISYLREIHGDINGAIKAMEFAVGSGFPGYEETAWAMLTLGELYLQYNELEKAEKTFKAILEIRTDYPFAVAALGSIYYQQGKLEKAEKTIQTAMNIIPEVGFYIQMAQLYKDQNRTNELVAIEKEIFVMLQDDVDSGHNMNLEYADLYFNLLDDTDKALAYAKTEYEKRPQNIDVNRMMAKIYAKKKNRDLMELHTKLAATTNSAHPELLNLLLQQES